jgi:hypothetical protein
MSATEPLSLLIGINPTKLSKEENIILEIELFSRICEELKEVFRQQHREYFHLMKLNKEMENTMLESKLIRFIIQDILSTKEYTIEGIARYAATHEDVLYEIYAELNQQPSATLLRKIIELHRMVRRELYQKITKKIAYDYLSVA